MFNERLKMLRWSIKEIELPLKFTWNISRNSSDIKRNFIIELKDGPFVSRGEVAFNVRYDESRELILQKFDEFKQSAPDHFNGVESLVSFLDKLDLPLSLRFGIESAFWFYVAECSGKTLQQLLGVNTISCVQTSFSIPIMDINILEKFILENNLKRFSSLKVKVNRENALEFSRRVLELTNCRLRIDANESFQSASEVMKFLENVENRNRIEFLEQPLPSSMHDEALELKRNTDVMLIADESVTNEDVTSYFVERFHGINIKLMKSGSLLKAVKQLRTARDLGLKTMLGCMIETSLSISQAIVIGGQVDFFDLDGFMLIKNDPYGLITEDSGRLCLNHIQ